MRPLRSLLFVPGNRASWMEKATQYGADALILDLEDSVPLTEKASARPLVRQAIERLSMREQTLYVRVNALESGMTGEDLQAIVCSGLNGLLPPKVETVKDVEQLDTLLTHFERQGTAAVTYQGAMVDIAMVKTAQEVLALAQAVGVQV